MTKLCSACLLGINCKYDGTNNLNNKVVELSKKEVLIPVCPEQLGGEPTPRPSSGIYGGTGADVLKSNATVRTINDGKDVTKYYTHGAEEVLKIAKMFGTKEAILKARSPSCGCGQTWQLDEKFVNHIVKGDGVTVALLKKNGIKIITEEQL